MNSSSLKNEKPAKSIKKLYDSVEVLSLENHQNLRLKQYGQYNFARSLRTCPVNVVEFIAIGRQMPILFMRGDPSVPIALMGVKRGENLMIDSTGKWRIEGYVPSYLRRYPFIVRRDDVGEVELCIDGNARNLSNRSGELLFDNNQATRITERMAKFSALYSKEQARTYQFCRFATEKNLFREGDLEIRAGSEKGIRLKGFISIDPEKLRSLDDASILHIWKMGWAGAIYAHLDSLGQFQNLLERAK